MNPSTGAIGNDASYNTDISTLTGSGVSAASDEFFINNVYEGAIAEVSIFNYSLHSLNPDLPALMYNNGCPPDMSTLPIFNDIVNQPYAYYKMGGLQQQLVGPPGATLSPGPPDTSGSASWAAWDPAALAPPTGARLQNAVPALWGSTDTIYAMGDGYPVRDVNDALVGIANINMRIGDDGAGFSPGPWFIAIGPCSGGYQAVDKSTLIAAPIYNRKHSLGSIYSVAQFGWSFPKEDYSLTLDYSDRTLSMPIPETSASFAAIFSLYSEGTASLDSNFVFQRPLGTTSPGYASVSALGDIQHCGGSAEWESGRLAGLVKNGSWISSPQVPFYNSYDDYSINMRLKNQHYSIIPEFIISDQIDFYINRQNGDFLAANPSQFEIPGTLTSSLLNTPVNSSDDGFYEVFSNSDFLKNFYVIKEDLRESLISPSTITLKCKALMKFLPYDGFFPSERSLQIANQFSKSYGSFVEYSGLDSNLTGSRFRPFLTPFFRPGIVYNTIKSGLAVDFPVYTSSYQVIQPWFFNSQPDADDTLSGYYLLGTQDHFKNAFITGSAPGYAITASQTASWDLRIPFEAVVEPEKYVQNITIYDMEPHPSSAIDIQAKWTGEGNGLYKRMMHNYLAAIPEFFLPNGEFTSLKSKPESEYLTVQSGTSYGMRVKVRRTMNKPRHWRNYTNSDPIINYECPQDPRALIGEAEGLHETFTMYSRPSAFGPPVAGTQFFGFQNTSVTTPLIPTITDNYLWNTKLYPSDSLMGINPSFTPPYYGRNSWVDIVFKAKTSGPVTLDEILSQAETNYWAIDTNPIFTGITSSASSSLIGNDRQQAIWSTTEDWWGIPKTGPTSDEIENLASPMRVSFANAYAMQINASFNIFGKTGDRWVVEQKFETPHYNFNSETSIRPITSASNTLTIPTNGSESVPRGMWHQFGTIETDHGIYIDIGPIPEEWRGTRGYADPYRVTSEQWPSNDRFQDIQFKTELLSGIDLLIYQNDKFEDLSKLVGFETGKKLGNTANSLTVYEAVVAVPFITENGRKQFFEIPENAIRAALGDLDTISSNKSVFQAGKAVKAALQAIENNRSLLDSEKDKQSAKVRAAAMAAATAAANQQERDEETADKVSDTIKDMVSKMKKYVFPPKMDFVTNLGKVTPFAMYIFEFSKTFDQNDLAHIWQNVSPPSSTEFAEQEAQISHKLFANELMGSFGNGNNDPIKENLQWMVFKVKQRANNNYFSKIAKESGPKTEQFQYSYNWPYDFFSLVEFVNMETKIGFGKGLDDGGVNQEVAEVRENPLKVATKRKLKEKLAGASSQEKKEILGKIKKKVGKRRKLNLHSLANNFCLLASLNLCTMLFSTATSFTTVLTVKSQRFKTISKEEFRKTPHR